MVADFVESGAKVGDLVDKGVKVGSEGLDKIMPIVEKVGKVADTAGKVASLFGKKGEGRRAKDTRVLSGKQQLYKGGDMSVNTPPRGRRCNRAGSSRHAQQVQRDAWG